MKKWEKILIIFLLVIVVSTSVMLVYKKYISNTKLVPAYGGVYSEGIIANKEAEIDQVIQKLTKIGLTYLDSNGNIEPAIAEKWEISGDGKTYIFKLRNGFDSGKLTEIIKSHKNGWDGITIENPDNSTIKFTLNEAYSPFLKSTSQPIFEYGPYELKKQDSIELVFESRQDFILGKPYITEINLKLYPDENNLYKAEKQNKIMGMEIQPNSSIEGFINYQMTLPRYTVVFFNLNSPDFQNKDIRQKIKKDEKLDEEITANFVTVDKNENIQKAEELKEKWEKIGLKINVRVVDPIELQKEIIPNRDYDVLLYGLDYGYDPDPYPFWHSSQMAGNGLNLSNFSNQKADALLEEARQSTDEIARNSKYEEFQKILDDEVPAIFLAQYVQNFAVSEKVKGIVENTGITPADRFTLVWKWYIEEKRVKK